MSYWRKRNSPENRFNAYLARMAFTLSAALAGLVLLLSFLERHWHV
jgi:hypothetical protein